MSSLKGNLGNKKLNDNLVEQYKISHQNNCQGHEFKMIGIDLICCLKYLSGKKSVWQNRLPILIFALTPKCLNVKSAIIDILKVH